MAFAIKPYPVCNDTHDCHWWLLTIVLLSFMVNYIKVIQWTLFELYVFFCYIIKSFNHGINLSNAVQELSVMCYTKEHLNLLSTWSELNMWKISAARTVALTYLLRLSDNISRYMRLTTVFEHELITLQKIKFILLFERRICVDIV